MQVDELFSLSKWYVQNVSNKKLPEILNQMQNQMRNPQKVNAVAPQVANELQSRFIPLLQEIDRSSITPNQRKCIEHLGIEGIVLETAEKRYEHIVRVARSDHNHLRLEIERENQLLQTVNTYMINLYNCMQQILPMEFSIPAELPDDNVVMRLTFHNEASIDNVVEFDQWSKSWLTIARGFSMSVNLPPEEFKIINADRGSFIVDLAIGTAVVRVIAKTLKELADAANGFADLYLKLKQAKELEGVVPDEVFQPFVDAAETKIKEQEEQVVASVIEKLKAEEIISNHTAINELTKAIKELNKFNNKGGSLQCLSSASADVTEENLERLNTDYKLLQDNKEIKLLEEKVHSDSSNI